MAACTTIEASGYVAGLCDRSSYVTRLISNIAFGTSRTLLTLAVKAIQVGGSDEVEGKRGVAFSTNRALFTFYGAKFNDFDIGKFVLGNTQGKKERQSQQRGRIQ